MAGIKSVNRYVNDSSETATITPFCVYFVHKTAVSGVNGFAVYEGVYSSAGDFIYVRYTLFKGSAFDILPGALAVFSFYGK